MLVTALADPKYNWKIILKLMLDARRPRCFVCYFENATNLMNFISETEFYFMFWEYGCYV